MQKIKVEEPYKVTCCDALRFLENATEKYDMIYIDPPYKSDFYEKLLRASVSAIKEDGIVVFESEKPFDGNEESLVLYDRRKYGRAHLTFFRKEEN